LKISNFQRFVTESDAFTSHILNLPRRSGEDELSIIYVVVSNRIIRVLLHTRRERKRKESATSTVNAPLQYYIFHYLAVRNTQLEDFV
jgi:hypothetical protein